MKVCGLPLSVAKSTPLVFMVLQLGEDGGRERERGVEGEVM